MEDEVIFKEVANKLIVDFPYMSTYIISGMSEIGEMHRRQEEYRKEILKKWDETKNYPRKLKKKTRKHLALEWSIANWSPFEF